MPRTPENLPRHELIGLPVEVVDAADTGMVGISGTVVDETRNTLIIEDDTERQVPKEDTVFRFTLDDQQVRVDGDLLVGRPEERILKKLPRKWQDTD